MSNRKLLPTCAEDSWNSCVCSFCGDPQWTAEWSGNARDHVFICKACAIAVLSVLFADATFRIRLDTRTGDRELEAFAGKYWRAQMYNNEAKHAKDMVRQTEKIQEERDYAANAALAEREAAHYEGSADIADIPPKGGDDAR